MKKTIIAPIIAVLVLFVQSVFHVDVPDTLVAQITDWVVIGGSLVLSVVGIFKNHHK